jgi:hypothetical protein
MEKLQAKLLVKFVLGLLENPSAIDGAVAEKISRQFDVPTPLVMDLAHRLSVNFQATDTVNLTRLMPILYPLGKVTPFKQELFNEIASLNKVQRTWVNWERVNDREELRQRLIALGNVGTLIPELYPFLVFFFRASDPSMYQAAAISMGKQINCHSEFKSFLVNYSKERKIDFSGGELVLNNIRSSRRILLVKTLAYCQDDDSQSLPFPFDVQRVVNSGNADKVIYLQATYELVKAFPSDKIVQDFGLELAVALSENEAWFSSRRLLIHWTRLTLALFGFHSLKIKKLLKSRFEQLLSSYSSLRFKEEDSLIFFMKADSFIRELSLGHHEWVHEVFMQGVENVQNENFKSFLLSAIKFHTQDNEITLEGIAPMFKIRNNLEACNYRRISQEDYQFLVEVLANLNMQPVWNSYTLETRAYLAFMLIHLGTSEFCYTADYKSLLNTLNINKKPEADELVRFVIAHLIHYADFSEVVDDILIHQLSDDHLLYELLHQKQQIEFLPVLADAVEHRLRMKLILEDAPNPFLFLYGFTIKKPPVEFFKILSQIFKGRVYVDKHKKHYQPELMCKSIVAEITDEEIDNFNSFGQDNDFVTQLLELRQALRAFEPFSLDKINSFLNLIYSDKQEGNTDLVSFIKAINVGEKMLIHADYDSQQSIDEFISQVADLVNSLQKELVFIFPESLTPDVTFSDKLQGFVAKVNELKRLFLVKLPYTERKLLKEKVNALVELLNLWNVQVLNSVSYFEKHDSHDLLIDYIQHIDSEFERHLLIELFWESIFSHWEQSDMDKTWKIQFDFVEWAISKEQSQQGEDVVFWQNRVAIHAKKLIAIAIENGYEQGVVRLLSLLNQHKHYDFVMEEMAESRTLPFWFFDRFDLFHSYKILAKSAHAKFVPVKSFLSFLGRFSEIWLSLLIGAILMLDFGDAWKAMAEEGDTQGILMTSVLGGAGTFLYLLFTLRSKSKRYPGQKVPLNLLSQFARVLFFFTLCVIYTLAITAFLWYLLSGTEEVVHGSGAVLHVIVWTSFALFVGVFFGLLAKNT